MLTPQLYVIQDQERRGDMKLKDDEGWLFTTLATIWTLRQAVLTFTYILNLFER